MKPLHKVLFILTLLLFLFLAVDADTENSHILFNHKIPMTRFPGGDQNSGGDQILHGSGVTAKPDFETQFPGHWDIINPESGVSAMHVNLMPNNKIIVLDATIFHISRLLYPKGVPCVPFEDQASKKLLQDCFVHSMEYDIETNKVRPLKVVADPWCSSGGLAPDGTLVNSGGFLDGGKAMRYFGGPKCQDKSTCDWREGMDKLTEDRWYGTQVILPDGQFIVMGGRRSFSYEFIPKEGQASQQPFFFPFLYETSDIDENNLYPFIHLSTDGNLFVFSNNRSLLLNPTTNKILRTYPVLPGGSRNYPASGMSAMLPVDLNGPLSPTGTIKVEVIVCGGNTHDSFYVAETRKVFMPALQDCSRMVITDQNPKWESEQMPSRRVLGDCLNLPNGNLLFINGAQKGTAAWWDADEPNFTPVMYNPKKPAGQRFTVLKPSQIARMYHSTSAVLPSGKIWVGGSNTHDGYRDKDRFPTETRIEAFSPPYLDPNFDRYRPNIVEATSGKTMKYNDIFETHFTLQDTDRSRLLKRELKVTIYFPPFTTHGYSMSQRLVVLRIAKVKKARDGYMAILKAPPSGKVAPPGYYLLFVVHRGVPSKGMWVHFE
ncbi:hypothetical protein RJT34_29501 [Clitoria ternatea]|uniref:Galactose oxidase n=1 Tax=Clitoria ternatea TaxID=43366 RepID=A0AAN9IHL2_CLITE